MLVEIGSALIAGCILGIHLLYKHELKTKNDILYETQCEVTRLRLLIYKEEKCEEPIN